MGVTSTGFEPRPPSSPHHETSPHHEGSRHAANAAQTASAGQTAAGAAQSASSPRPAPPAVRPSRPPKIVDLDAERPLPSIERALSAPGARRDISWRRRVKVVVGGQGPRQRDQESLDRDRAKLPLAGSRCIVVLGCHAGAGQTTTTLITSRMLASLRGHPIAALDLNADRAETVKAANLDIIAPGQSPDYHKLAELYPLTFVDPVPSGMARVLKLADQLIIVAPPSPEGSSSLANTQQWLEAHGYADLANRAVTVLNGVRKQAMSDALRVESVARGRCRAIVRVPWDDQVAVPPAQLQVPQVPQTRLAYTALAGVLIAGMAAPAPGSGRSPGEHEG